MKKLIFSTLFLFALTIGAFAHTEKVSQMVNQSFQTSFQGASDVVWSVNDIYSKASFSYQGKKMEVYYRPDGSTMATCKNLEFCDLPFKAQQKFTKKYAGYKVVENAEYSSEDEVSYYISAENEKEFIVIHVTDGNVMGVEKRIKK